jgi:hypothetical protein
MHKLTLNQFRTTLDTGGVLSVSLVAHGGVFQVHAETRRGEAVLTKARGQSLRTFRNVTKALGLLRDLGIREARVDTREWRPEEADLEKVSRPDSAAKLKATHEAAAHDAWFREQVEAAVAKADNGDAQWIDEAEWGRRVAEKRRALEAAGKP